MTWIGVVIGFQTIMGAIVTGIFTYLNGRISRDRERDKMEFDAKFVALQTQQLTDKQHHEECEEKYSQVLEKLERCEDKHEQTESRLVELENKLKNPAPGSGVYKRRNTGGPQPGM